LGGAQTFAAIQGGSALLSFAVLNPVGIAAAGVVATGFGLYAFFG
jgi:hypothetical protein